MILMVTGVWALVMKFTKRRVMVAGHGNGLAAVTSICGMAIKTLGPKCALIMEMVLILKKEALLISGITHHSLGTIRMMAPFLVGRRQETVQQ